MKYADIATGESEFSINLLKQEANRRNFNCHYDVYLMDIILNLLKRL